MVEFAWVALAIGASLIGTWVFLVPRIVAQAVRAADETHAARLRLAFDVVTIAESYVTLADQCDAVVAEQPHLPDVEVCTLVRQRLLASLNTPTPHPMFLAQLDTHLTPSFVQASRFVYETHEPITFGLESMSTILRHRVLALRAYLYAAPFRLNGKLDVDDIANLLYLPMSQEAQLQKHPEVAVTLVHPEIEHFADFPPNELLARSREARKLYLANAQLKGRVELQALQGAR